MRLMRDRTVSPQAFAFSAGQAMYICYLDESGTEQLGSGTSHFVYLGLAISATTWKAKDQQVSGILAKYDLQGAEVHTGWIARRFIEQELIPDFEKLGNAARRSAVRKAREEWLIKTAALGSKPKLENLKKTLRKTEAYTHLSATQRAALLRELADLIGSWSDARLFCEACDKSSYGATVPETPLYEAGFTQLVSRFQAFLTNKGTRDNSDLFGLLVHDNNETVSRRLTDLMRRFHKDGTLWRKLTRIVETPMFVDSKLTVMVQLADLCAYATRRFFENGETDLFNRIYPKFDRTGARVVGIRHFRYQKKCDCVVCKEHK